MNPNNSDAEGIDMLGPEQVAWLKEALKSSTATWKIIASSDPFSIVSGGEGDADAWSQGEAAVLGREVELADILGFIKEEGITNVHTITADVHFSAVLKYNPDVVGALKEAVNCIISPVQNVGRSIVACLLIDPG